MDEKQAKLYLTALLDYVFDLLHVRGFGVNHGEHLFRQVWKVLLAQPGLKIWFMKCINESVRSADRSLAGVNTRPDWFVDSDLICFIAHSSRWQEFAELAEQRRSALLASGSIHGSRDISDSILEALEDDWEDRDFYECCAD